ncbi:MAG: response regulator transcription factor [Chloroflexota bacterium]
MTHILIVDDEPNVASALSLLLQSAQYETTVVHSGRMALDTLATPTAFDLVLLDLNLGDPLINGLMVCREIRLRPVYLPVIILTVHDSADEKVMGLDLGADDYITKPYNDRELLARIRAALRTVAARTPSHTDSILRIDNYLEIDSQRRKVYLTGEEVELTRRQFDLLLYLVLNPDRPWGRQTLLSRVWGEDFVGIDRTVDRHISDLRQKLEPDPNNPIYILTEHGFGYRFRQW